MHIWLAMYVNIILRTVYGCRKQGSQQWNGQQHIMHCLLNPCYRVRHCSNVFQRSRNGQYTLNKVTILRIILETSIAAFQRHCVKHIYIVNTNTKPKTRKSSWRDTRWIQSSKKSAVGGMPLHDNGPIICPLHCSLYAQIPISPVHDLILGNIEGARAPDEPDWSWEAVKQ